MLLVVREELRRRQEVRSSVEYVATAEEIGMTVILFGELTKIYIPKKLRYMVTGGGFSFSHFATLERER